MVIKDFISKISTEKSKKAGSLFFSTFISIFVGIGISIINTRFLGPKLYGDFKFIISIFSFFTTFATLGIFYSGARLIAINSNKHIKHKLIGALILFTIIASSFLIIVVFIFSFIQDDIFDNNLSTTIRIFAPLILVLPLQLLSESILQGDNRIYHLATMRLGPKIIYLISAIIINYIVPLNLNITLSLHLISIGLLVIWVVFQVKPNFRQFKPIFNKIWEENKKYGFHVYLGAITGLASAQLGGISIAYFIDNTNVGYYSLAITTTMSLTLIPSIVGTTFFKDFANMLFIPKKVVLITSLISISALLVFLLLIKFLVVLFYKEDFIAVVPLAKLIAFGSVFHGFGDFINRFLAAHGKGKQLRNSNFILFISNTIGFIILVKYFGVSGAAITRVISGLIYFFIMFYYYKKTRSVIKYEL